MFHRIASVRLAFVFVVALLVLCREARSCKPGPGWAPASFEAQWLASEWVIQGETEFVNTVEFTSTVHVKNFVTRKGEDLSCARISISGFTSSAACGIDPPPEGSKSTFFLCSLETTDETGSCKAKMNTEGNIAVGMVYEVHPDVDGDLAPATCPQTPGTCRGVDECEPSSSGSKSRKCCQKMSENKALKFRYNGDKAVCATGKIEGNCKTSTWEEAKDDCERKGYRLCTYSELEAREATGVGCGTKKKLAWTSGTCGSENRPGYIAATTGNKAGDPIEESCKRGKKDMAQVICCADRC
jgi:hypothetical protein